MWCELGVGAEPVTDQSPAYTPPEPPPRREVLLQEVPLEPLVELQLYFDDMVRELQLIEVGRGEAGIADRLHRLAVHTQHEIARARNDLHVQARAGLDAGEVVSDLVVDLRPSAVAASRALHPARRRVRRAERERRAPHLAVLRRQARPPPRVDRRRDREAARQRPGPPALRRRVRALNVLYITVDQWRGDCLSAAGHPVVRDADARRAGRRRACCFANHWANTAPCGPSRTTLHTGHVRAEPPLGAERHAARRPLHQHRARGARRPATTRRCSATPTPASTPAPCSTDDPRLRTYEGVLPGLRPGGERPGGDRRAAAWGRWLADAGRRRAGRPARPLRARPVVPRAPTSTASSWAPDPLRGRAHRDGVPGRAACIDWLEPAVGDEPWFVHASFIRPHPPYRNPVGYHDRYAADDGPAFRGHADREAEIGHATRWPAMAIPHPRRGLPDRRPRPPPAARHLLRDDGRGRRPARPPASRWLDDAGLADDTLVVLTSDHGDQMGDHWLVEKLGWWDESYHVPLIVLDPRPEADARRGARSSRSFTEHVDVMPTICAWLGVEVPLQCDGRALQPFLHERRRARTTGAPSATGSGTSATRRPTSPRTCSACPMEQCSLNVVRGDRWKYVHFATDPDALPPLLFDLAADPDQVRRTWPADPAHAGVRGRRGRRRCCAGACATTSARSPATPEPERGPRRAPRPSPLTREVARRPHAPATSDDWVTRNPRTARAWLARGPTC